MNTIPFRPHTNNELRLTCMSTGQQYIVNKKTDRIVRVQDDPAFPPPPVEQSWRKMVERFAQAWMNRPGLAVPEHVTAAVRDLMRDAAIQRNIEGN